VSRNAASLEWRRASFQTLRSFQKLTKRWESSRLGIRAPITAHGTPEIGLPATTQGQHCLIAGEEQRVTPAARQELDLRVGLALIDFEAER